MAKSPDAFRTISEVAEWLNRPAHVLRFWESKFTQVKPVKRAGGRRYYRRQDMLLLGGIKTLLHDDGMTIKGVQKLLREQGVKHVTALSQPLAGDDDTAEDQTQLSDTNSPTDAVPESVSADNLVSFPSAEPPAAKKKPPFEREPEQAVLFEMADSVAPELDDIYLVDPDAPTETVEEPEDVPLPLGDLDADTDTVQNPRRSGTEATPEPLDALPPQPGLLSAIVKQVEAQNTTHPEAAALADLCDHLRSHITQLHAQS